jgi:hypothetical protein
MATGPKTHQVDFQNHRRNIGGLNYLRAGVVMDLDDQDDGQADWRDITRL